MFEIIGKYNQATVYAATVDSEAYAQVLRMCNREELGDCRIRMMPDMHAAEGCTVGTSMTVGGRVNPAYVGGDIGCGMQVYRLDTPSGNFAALDEAIRERVPSGAAVFPSPNSAVHRVPLEDLSCYESISHHLVSRSFGTLGGGGKLTAVALPRDGWKGGESPYAQQVDVEGVTRNSMVNLLLTAEQLQEFHDMDLAFTTVNEDGAVTVYAIGDKPEKDYEFQAVLLEVIT